MRTLTIKYLKLNQVAARAYKEISICNLFLHDKSDCQVCNFFSKLSFKVDKVLNARFDLAALMLPESHCTNAWCFEWQRTILATLLRYVLILKQSLANC